MSNKTDVSAFCSLSLVLLDRTKKLERKRLRRSWTKRKTMAQPKEFVTGERRGQMMPTVMCTMYYNQTTGRRELCQLSAPTINDRSPNASMLTKSLCFKTVIVHFIQIFLLQKRYSNIFLVIDIYNLYILYIRVLDISIL